MFDLSLSEILIVIVLTLIVVRPEDVPGIMRSAGRGVRKIKKAGSDFMQLLDDTPDGKGVVGQIVDLEGNLRETYDVSDLSRLREKAGNPPSNKTP